jgi:hypothetical protein
MKCHLMRVLRFGKLVATDRRLPRPVRYGLVVCLLIPGPVDELLAIPAILAVLVWRRQVVFDCWRMSAPVTFESAAVMHDGEVVWVEVPR